MPKRGCKVSASLLGRRRTATPCDARLRRCTLLRDNPVYHVGDTHRRECQIMRTHARATGLLTTTTSPFAQCRSPRCRSIFSALVIGGALSTLYTREASRQRHLSRSVFRRRPLVKRVFARSHLRSSSQTEVCPIRGAENEKHAGQPGIDRIPLHGQSECKRLVVLRLHTVTHRSLIGHR